MRGIPRQAVWAKSPVLGTNGITANMIADTSSKCDWLNHMYGLNMDSPGAQAYLNSLLKLYASWGVDFIKVDDIARPYHKKEIEGYRIAIEQCGRPIILSISPGETPVSEAEHVSKNANMWRIADDFWDNWEEIVHMFDYARRWEGTGGNGHWPDCDMLQIGKLSKRGPVGKTRYSRFTDDELYTHMTFWCIFRSPLMIGGNLPENRPIEQKLFTNPEVLAVDQQGIDPKQLYKKEDSMVWYSHVPNSPDVYVALFNTGGTAHDVTIDFASIGLQGSIQVRNLWEKQNAGTYKNTYSKPINKHGAALLRLTPLSFNNK